MCRLAFSQSRRPPSLKPYGQGGRCLGGSLLNQKRDWGVCVLQGRLSVTEITTNVQCTYRCTRSHVWYRGEAPQPETGRRTATRWLLIRSYCTLRATKVALDCLYCLLQRRRPNGAGAAVFRPKGLFAFSLLLSLLFRGGLKAVVYRGRRRKHDGRVRSSLYSKPKRARFAELTVLSPPDRKVSQGFESGLQRSLGLTHGRGRCQRFGFPRIFGCEWRVVRPTVGGCGVL